MKFDCIVKIYSVLLSLIGIFDKFIELAIHNITETWPIGRCKQQWRNLDRFYCAFPHFSFIRRHSRIMYCKTRISTVNLPAISLPKNKFKYLVWNIVCKTDEFYNQTSSVINRPQNKKEGEINGCLLLTQIRNSPFANSFLWVVTAGNELQSRKTRTAFPEILSD